MNQKEIRRYINVIKRAVSYIESMLDSDDGGLMEQWMQPPTPVGQPPQPVPAPIITVPPVPVEVEHSIQVDTKPPEIDEVTKMHMEARKKHVQSLMEIDCWPEAVPPFLMAKDASLEDQVNRANAVLDMMLDRNVEGLNFLDFGCGEGWIAQEILKRGVVESVGYDVQPSEKWSELKGPKMTSSLSDLKMSYYDVIMLYDVLDHCQDPIETMGQVKHCLKKGGVVYVRCHPWTSKHATHLYKQGINRAYVHMFLNWQEINEIIGHDQIFTRQEKTPIEAYHWWFSQFEIKKERMVREAVSEFFHVPAFKELLSNEQGITDINAFLKLMEIQFVDYVLVLK
jgi:SAM-dependent methyltransferase